MPSPQATLRHQAIIDALNARGNVAPRRDLADQLSVSAVTIRADLDYLEAPAAAAPATRGGARYGAARAGSEQPLELTSPGNAEAKKRNRPAPRPPWCATARLVIIDVGVDH